MMGNGVAVACLVLKKAVHIRPRNLRRSKPLRGLPVGQGFGITPAVFTKPKPMPVGTGDHGMQLCGLGLLEDLHCKTRAGVYVLNRTPTSALLGFAARFQFAFAHTGTAGLGSATHADK
jgi:hypothetical protein